MKKVFILFTFMFVAVSLNAQNIFVPKKGVELVYKVSVSSFAGNQEMYVTEKIESENENELVLATSTYQNENDKSPIKVFLKRMKKTEEGYVVNLADVIKENLGGQFPDMKFADNNAVVEFPFNVACGMSFANQSISITANVYGQDVEMSVLTKNRKIADAKETVKVPVGEYECYVVEYDNVFEAMGMEQVSNRKEYYATDLGLVKSIDNTSSGAVTVTVTTELIQVK